MTPAQEAAQQVWRDCLNRIDRRDKIVFVNDAAAIAVIMAALTRTTEAARQEERERCCQTVCLDCQNPSPEFQARQDSNGDWYHQAIGWRRLCRAEALRHPAPSSPSEPPR